MQLDKNSGGKKLRDLCNQQGLVKCFLLPRLMRDKASDPDVADFAIRHQNLTVTFDTTFSMDAAVVLAGRSPGLLLLRADDGDPRQITTKTAAPMLARFKDEFPDWHTVPWRNSFIELTPTLVYVHHTTLAPPTFIEVLNRGTDGWQEMLRGHLQANARMLDADDIGDQDQAPPALEHP